MIRLNDQSENKQPVRMEDMAQVTFAEYAVPQPAMSIWLMTMPANQPVFPWWSYEAKIDEDVHRLSDLWAISSAQNLFDFLYLSFLRRAMGPNLYFILPGNIRTEGWKNLPDGARSSFERGQGCVYRLEGSYSSKLGVNWVPFYQQQSLVRDPGFESLWRLFVSARTEDVSNSISFFSLKDLRRMPEVVNLLIQPDEQRSEKMAKLVDWFGLYTSPIHPSYGTGSVVYTGNPATLKQFTGLQQRFENVVEQMRIALAEDAQPATVLRLVSRLIAI